MSQYENIFSFSDRWLYCICTLTLRKYETTQIFAANTQQIFISRNSKLTLSTPTKNILHRTTESIKKIKTPSKQLSITRFSSKALKHHSRIRKFPSSYPLILQRGFRIQTRTNTTQHPTTQTPHSKIVSRFQNSRHVPSIIQNGHHRSDFDVIPIRLCHGGRLISPPADSIIFICPSSHAPLSRLSFDVNDYVI